MGRGFVAAKVGDGPLILHGDARVAESWAGASLSREKPDVGSVGSVGRRGV